MSNARFIAGMLFYVDRHSLPRFRERICLFHDGGASDPSVGTNFGTVRKLKLYPVATIRRFGIFPKGIVSQPVVSVTSVFCLALQVLSD